MRGSDGELLVLVCCGGAGFDAPPTIEIDAPSAGGRSAAAEAYVEDGRVTRIEVTDQGSGYVLDERPVVSIIRQMKQTRGVDILMLKDHRRCIEVMDQGSGYALDRCPVVSIQRQNT